VEAVLLGIDCVGFDISPLSIIQSKVKVDSVPALSEIRETKATIVQGVKDNQKTPKELLELISSLEKVPVRDFYRMAYLVSVSDSARRKREFMSSFLRNLELMLGSVGDFADVASELGLTLGKANLREGDARELPLGDHSMDGIVTSPPYSIALDYISNDAHAFTALGYDLQQLRGRFIGVRGRGAKRVDLYNQDMVQSFKEMSRVLKSGKLCTIIIGDASLGGQRLSTVDFTVKQCHAVGLRLIRNIPKIIFGLYNVMQTENILIFQKV
jgi:hypothetical protein